MQTHYLELDAEKYDREMLQTVHSIAKYLPIVIHRVEQFRKALEEDEELKEIQIIVKRDGLIKRKFQGI